MLLGWIRAAWISLDANNNTTLAHHAVVVTAMRDACLLLVVGTILLARRRLSPPQPASQCNVMWTGQYNKSRIEAHTNSCCMERAANNSLRSLHKWLLYTSSPPNSPAIHPLTSMPAIVSTTFNAFTFHSRQSWYDYMIHIYICMLLNATATATTPHARPLNRRAKQDRAGAQ